VKVLALDYGRARTGVAVSDATGILARPLALVERVGSPQGFSELCAIIAEERPELVLVGLPRTLRGELGPQAQATLAFVGRLRTACQIPIRTEDERFTTTIARRTAGPSPRTGSRRTADDPAAAAVLLQGFLDRRSRSDDGG
jgi:putative Holliday junction resolvase